MKSFFAVRYLHSLKLFIICVLAGGSSFAALAGQSSIISSQSLWTKMSFSLTEYLVAIVLGITFVALLMARLLADHNNLAKRFVVAVTFTLLISLFATTYWPAISALILNISLVVLSAIFTLWLLVFSDKSSFDRSFNFSVIAISTLMSLATVMFLPSAFFWLIWLVFAITIASASGLHLFKHVREHLKVRAFSQWFVTAAFLVSLVFWAKQVLAFELVVVFGICLYLSAQVNQTWLSIKALKTKQGEQGEQDAENNGELNEGTDVATNLPGHKQAMMQLEQLVARNARDSKKRYAVVTFKPVNFDRVNMVLGHHNSDILLLQLAYCLQHSSKSYDALHNFSPTGGVCRIARLQGLNFMVVLDLTQTNHPDHTVIEQLRKRLSTAVPAAMAFKSYSLNFKLAFGVALVGDHGNSAVEVVAHAVDALLEAEQNKQSLSYYDNKQTLYKESQLLQMEHLKQAIQEEKLHYFLQPQVHANGRKLVGLTLKAHWNVDTHKPLLLEQFIDIAEQSGEIFTLFRQVLQAAFSALTSLSELKIEHPVAIPIQSAALLEPDVIEYVEQKLKSGNFNSNQVVFDISEQLLLSDPQRVNSFTYQLQQAGVQVSISDFSGSYEALRYLRKLEIKKVSVDCAILAGHQNKNADKVIANALLSLCHTMNLTAVGTNVNTPDIERVFSSIGGVIMQGNIIDHGVSITDIEPWLIRGGYIRKASVENADIVAAEGADVDESPSVESRENQLTENNTLAEKKTEQP